MYESKLVTHKMCIAVLFESIDLNYYAANYYRECH
jgi:hypothetical protein